MHTTYIYLCIRDVYHGKFVKGESDYVLVVFDVSLVFQSFPQTLLHEESHDIHMINT